jgi:ubiquinone/menaquinone biosynthesis C-methylase UbiE
MQASENQQGKWEAYWKDTRDIAAQSYPEAQSVWDSEVEAGIELDLPRFMAHFDPALPVIDVGCGSGKQTARLARHFPRVLGTDVSASAVQFAAQAHPAKNLEYSVLDALSPSDARALHSRLGDANLYVRTVVHIFGDKERASLGEVLRILMGERGTMYNIELGPKSPEYFEYWIKTHGMPVKLARVMSKGLRPGPVGKEDIDRLFPPRSYETLDSGDAIWAGVRMTSQELVAAGRREGEIFEPPMYYSLIRKRSGN